MNVNACLLLQSHTDEFLVYILSVVGSSKEKTYDTIGNQQK